MEWVSFCLDSDLTHNQIKRPKLTFGENEPLARSRISGVFYLHEHNQKWHKQARWGDYQPRCKESISATMTMKRQHAMLKMTSDLFLPLPAFPSFLAWPSPKAENGSPTGGKKGDESRAHKSYRHHHGSQNRPLQILPGPCLVAQIWQC
jgi:hypothetical protein